MFARKSCACEAGRGDGPGEAGGRARNRAADTESGRGHRTGATPAGDRYGDYPAESV